MKDVRVFYIAARLSHIRPTGRRFMGDGNTSPRLGILDNRGGSIPGSLPKVARAMFRMTSSEFFRNHSTLLVINKS